MGRGLDGYFDIRALALCGFEGPRRGPERSLISPKAKPLAAERGLYKFPVAMARGKHLFPFRTEPLSPSAPMVLGPQGPGRVGRRRFFSDPVSASRGGVFCLGKGIGPGRAARIAPCRTRAR